MTGMPRSNARDNLRAIRAYHRASAALRDRHRDEWEMLRAHFLQVVDPATLSHPQSRGPAKGSKPFRGNIRKATPTDVAHARKLIVDIMKGPRPSATQVLKALAEAGFLLMRSVPEPSAEPTDLARIDG